MNVFDDVKVKFHGSFFWCLLNTSLDDLNVESDNSIDEWIGVGTFMNCSDEVLGVKWNGNHAHVHSMGKTGIFYLHFYRKTLAIHVPI